MSSQVVPQRGKSGYVPVDPFAERHRNLDQEASEARMIADVLAQVGVGMLCHSKWAPQNLHKNEHFVAEPQERKIMERQGFKFGKNNRVVATPRMLQDAIAKSMGSSSTPSDDQREFDEKPYYISPGQMNDFLKQGFIPRQLAQVDPQHTQYTHAAGTRAGQVTPTQSSAASSRFVTADGRQKDVDPAEFMKAVTTGKSKTAPAQEAKVVRSRAIPIIDPATRQVRSIEATSVTSSPSPESRFLTTDGRQKDVDPSEFMKAVATGKSPEPTQASEQKVTEQKATDSKHVELTLPQIDGPTSPEHALPGATTIPARSQPIKAESVASSSNLASTSRFVTAKGRQMDMDPQDFMAQYEARRGERARAYASGKVKSAGEQKPVEQKLEKPTTVSSPMVSTTPNRVQHVVAAALAPTLNVETKSMSSSSSVTSGSGSRYLTEQGRQKDISFEDFMRGKQSKSSRPSSFAPTRKAQNEVPNLNINVSSTVSADKAVTAIPTASVDSHDAGVHGAQKGENAALVANAFTHSADIKTDVPKTSEKPVPTVEPTFKISAQSGMSRSAHNPKFSAPTNSGVTSRTVTSQRHQTYVDPEAWMAAMSARKAPTASNIKVAVSPDEKPVAVSNNITSLALPVAEAVSTIVPTAAVVELSNVGAQAQQKIVEASATVTPPTNTPTSAVIPQPIVDSNETKVNSTASQGPQKEMTFESWAAAKKPFKVSSPVAQGRPTTVTQHKNSLSPRGSSSGSSRGKVQYTTKDGKPYTPPVAKVRPTTHAYTNTRFHLKNDHTSDFLSYIQEKSENPVGGKKYNLNGGQNSKGPISASTNGAVAPKIAQQPPKVLQDLNVNSSLRAAPKTTGPETVKLIKVESTAQILSSNVGGPELKRLTDNVPLGSEIPKIVGPVNHEKVKVAVQSPAWPTNAVSAAVGFENFQQIQTMIISELAAHAEVPLNDNQLTREALSKEADVEFSRPSSDHSFNCKISDAGIAEQSKEVVRNTLAPDGAMELMDWDGTWAAAPCIQWEGRNPADTSFIVPYIKEWQANLPCGPSVTVDLSEEGFVSGKSPINNGNIAEPYVHPISKPDYDGASNKKKALHQTAYIDANNYLVRYEKHEAFKEAEKIAQAARNAEVALETDMAADGPNPFAPTIDMYLRPVQLKDADEILKIINHCIIQGIVPEDQEPLTRNNIVSLIQISKAEKLPFIVAVKGRLPTLSDAQGRKGRSMKACMPQYESIIGFALAEHYNYGWSGSFGGRSRATALLHLYVQHEHTRKGVGRNLLDRLFHTMSHAYSYKNTCAWINPTNDKINEMDGNGAWHQLLFHIPVLEKNEPSTKWLIDYLWQKFWFQEVGRLPSVARSGLHKGAPKWLDLIILQATALQGAEFNGF